MAACMDELEAYNRIRTWYQANLQLLEGRADDYAIKSARLIRALPSTEKVTRAEIQAVFMHVITMYLEWGFGQSDGNLKMNEYVKMAVGPNFYLSDEQIEELKTSRLWPFLQRDIDL
jgi:hypothetical protein